MRIFFSLSGSILKKTVVSVLVILFTAAFAISCASTKSENPDTSTSPSPVAPSERSITSDILPVSKTGPVLVVFFSQGTATRRVAEDLALLTRGDLEEIVELKVRKGFFGFMGAGAQSTFRLPSRIETPVHDPAGYSAVYVCTPVWAWNLSPPVRRWLRLFQGTLPKAAFITVSGDTEPDKIVKAMTKESGREPFAFTGFSEADFLPENRDIYIKKISGLVDPLR